MEGLYSKVDLDDSEFVNKSAAKWLRFSSSTIIGSSLPELNNEGFINIAAMVKGYYDFVAKDTAFTSYVGIGGGITAIKFLGVFRGKFAYQGKVGIGYIVNPQCKIFSGYRYFGIIDDKFRKIKAPLKNQSRSLTIDFSNDFGIHGLEAGVIFNF